MKKYIYYKITNNCTSTLIQTSDSFEELVQKAKVDVMDAITEHFGEFDHPDSAFTKMNELFKEMEDLLNGENILHEAMTDQTQFGLRLQRTSGYHYFESWIDDRYKTHYKIEALP